MLGERRNPRVRFSKVRLKTGRLRGLDGNIGGRVVEIERFGVGKRLTDFIVHGDKIHFSGYVAEEAAGKSVTEQTRDILAQIDGSLAEAGSDKSKLIEATIWLADMATFGEMNAVWDAWVAPGRPPTRACVEARLASPQYAVEIRVLAAR